MSQDAFEHALDLKAETALALRGQADAEAVARAAHAEVVALQEKVAVSRSTMSRSGSSASASAFANVCTETSPWFSSRLRASVSMVIAALLCLARRETPDCCPVSVRQFTQIHVSGGWPGDHLFNC